LLELRGMAEAKRLQFAVEGAGEVSALLMMPAEARVMLVLAHGAGAGMSHPFLGSLAAELAAAGVATLRYQFPYMERRRGKPDSPAVAAATVAAAVRAAWEQAPDLALFAGGKSFGGRMTSQAAAKGLLSGVRGLAFFGFPLHPPNKPGTKRAEHLKQVTVPMLFLQGTRDTLADLTLLKPICKGLGSLATLHIIDTADHSFHMLKKSGKTDTQALHELAQTTASWALKI
jgi:predicted alpha/beta-hydrolase family hydrolase